MTGNCRDGWDIRVREDIDSVLQSKQYQSCWRKRFNLDTDSITIMGMTIDTDTSSSSPTHETFPESKDDDTTGLEHPYYHHHFFSAITSSHGPLEIRDNAGVQASFDRLESADTITVQGNGRSEIAWPALRQASTIYMRDNPGTKLPGNMDNLEFVHDVFLDGEVMTDEQTNNIFPNLVRATGTVIVESSEDQQPRFDCGALISQWEMGIISRLRCNGLDYFHHPAADPSAADSISSSDAELRRRDPAESAAAAPEAVATRDGEERYSAKLRRTRINNKRNNQDKVRSYRGPRAVIFGADGEGAQPVYDYHGLKSEDEVAPVVVANGHVISGSGGVIQGGQGLLTGALVMLGLMGLVLLGFLWYRKRESLASRRRGGYSGSRKELLGGLLGSFSSPSTESVDIMEGESSSASGNSSDEEGDAMVTVVVHDADGEEREVKKEKV